MWKIRRLQDAESVVLGLSGRIQGEQLMELQKLLASEAGNQNVVLDLQEVKLVDQDSVTFLACQETGGTNSVHPAAVRSFGLTVAAAVARCYPESQGHDRPCSRSTPPVRPFNEPDSTSYRNGGNPEIGDQRRTRRRHRGRRVKRKVSPA